MSDNSEPIIPSLNHVVGQTRAVNVLRTAIDAYFNERPKTGDNTALPHILMSGPGGTGKTLLSEIVAAECCTKCHTELAQNVASPGQMQGLLMMLEPGDILFLDEIHELTPAVQVCLYRAVENNKIFLVGNHKAITLPPFCLIGATTDEYMLTTSMRDRFKIVLRLTHYSEEEMTLLIRQRAKRLGWTIDDTSIGELAKRSRGVPRLAVRLLDAAKRVGSADSSDVIESRHVERMLDMEGIDSLGFDLTEQKYLHLLRQHQGPVRLNVIATHLGLPKQTIEMFEKDFIRLGLITKTEKGRTLTTMGFEHVKTISPNEKVPSDFSKDSE
jgi:holliday junction DNA helicase RuvB